MKKFFMIALTAVIGIILAADSAGVREAVTGSISLCLTVIIPSLFAFLALSSLLTALFPQAIFPLSLIGGYPAGAKLLAESNLLQERKEHMLMYCFCGSPAFITAIAPRAGLYIWLSNAIACVIICLLTRHRLPAKPGVCPETCPEACRPGGGDLFIRSISASGAALYKICLMIVAFSVITRILGFIGLSNPLLFAFLEITGVMRLTAPLPLIAALTSLGGICAWLQAAAMFPPNLRPNLRPFLLARIPAAALSAGICFLLTHGMAVETAAEPTAAAVTVHVLPFASGSPIASLCLLAMSGILLAQNPAPAKSVKSIRPIRS
jgi:hypothetical protein